jgi:hypothetical protein
MHTHSAARVITEDRIACLHKEASNSIAESNHASSTHSLKQVGQYDWMVQQEKGKQDQIMTLDEVTMLLYLEGHQKMEDWSAPLDAFILYQLNSNNQLLRLLDVELPMRENALMMPSINKRSHANKKKK